MKHPTNWKEWLDWEIHNYLSKYHHVPKMILLCTDTHEKVLEELNHYAFINLWKTLRTPIDVDTLREYSGIPIKVVDFAPEGILFVSHCTLYDKGKLSSGKPFKEEKEF